jgi:hypothetical protein
MFGASLTYEDSCTAEFARAVSTPLSWSHQKMDCSSVTVSFIIKSVLPLFISNAFIYNLVEQNANLFYIKILIYYNIMSIWWDFVAEGGTSF